MKRTCEYCKYFKYDSEYESQGLGRCDNDEVMQQRIMFENCDEFYITDDFGCIFFEKNETQDN